MFKAVIFDVDGTLTTSPRGNAWLDLTEQLGGDPEEHKDIFAKLSEGKFSLREAKDHLIQLWNKCGINESKIEEIYKKMPLRDGAEETLQYLNGKYTTCIITGSPKPFARITAERLEIPHYYGRTEFVWGEDGRMKDFEYEPEGGELKLKQLKEFIKAQKFELKECVPVGDGWNDNKLFTATGNGISIKSEQFDEELVEISWKKIKELHELKEIL